MQLCKVLKKLNIELNQDTTPADIMRQAAKGEIVLTIESDSSEHEINPTASFWAQVRKDNSNNIPQHKIYNVSFSSGTHWSNRDLSITPDALAKLSTDEQQRKDDLFNKQSFTGLNYARPYEIEVRYSLKTANIYTDYQPATANTAPPADTVESLQQQLNDARATIAELEKELDACNDSKGITVKRYEAAITIRDNHPHLFNNPLNRDDIWRQLNEHNKVLFPPGRTHKTFFDYHNKQENKIFKIKEKGQK